METQSTRKRGCNQRFFIQTYLYKPKNESTIGGLKQQAQMVQLSNKNGDPISSIHQESWFTQTSDSWDDSPITSFKYPAIFS
jgi:hypothetical protein